MRWVLRMNREANAAKIDAVLAAAGDRPIVEVSIRQYPRGLSVGAMTARMLSWIKALKKASLSYPISAIRWAGRSSVRILNVVRRGVVCLPAYEVEGERDAVDIIWRFLRCQGISFEQLCLHLSGPTHRGEAGHQSTGRVHDLPQSSRSCFVRACRSPARLTPSMSPQHPLRTKCQKIHGLLLSSISLDSQAIPTQQTRHWSCVAKLQTIDMPLLSRSIKSR